MKKIMFIFYAVLTIILMTITSYATSRIPRKPESSQWITQKELNDFLNYAERRMGVDMDEFLWKLVASASEAHGFIPQSQQQGGK